MLVRVNLDCDYVSANMTHVGKEASSLARAREATCVDADQVKGRSDGSAGGTSSEPGAVIVYVPVRLSW